MKTRPKLFTFALSCITVLSGVSSYADVQNPITRTEIVNTPLQAINGFRGIMYVTNIAPGAVAPRHSHAGYEFIFVDAGAVTFETDGEKPVTLKTGQAMLNPRGHIHKVSNASTIEPARLVVTLINEDGRPLAIPAE